MAKLKRRTVVQLALVLALPAGASALIMAESLSRGAGWDWSRAAALLAWFSAWLAIMSNLYIRELTRRLGMPFIKAHHILTAVSLAMMAAHPLLFVLRGAPWGLFVPTLDSFSGFLANGGRAALWLFAVGALAAVLRKRLARGWRWVHWLVYLGFILASIHGALIGTDFTLTGYRVLVALLNAAVVYAFIAKRLPARKPARAGDSTVRPPEPDRFGALEPRGKVKNKLIGWFTAASAAALVGVVLLTYGYALGMPLYWDDIWHFRDYVLSPSWPQVLTGWRPLFFGTFKALAALQNSIDPRGMHALNLAAHIINSLLCWGIARRLRLDKLGLAALGCGILFALYPFSAQAVSWVAALGHPLTAMLVMGSVLLYLLSRSPGRAALWLRIGSLALALLAPLANEAGVGVPVLIAGLLWLERAPRRSWLGLVPYLLCAAAAFTQMRAVKPFNDRLAQFALSPEDIKFKLAYLMQGLVYPAALPAAWLHRLGIAADPNWFAVCIYAAVGLVYAAWLYISKAWRIGLFAVLWFFVLALPATIMMPRDYVLSGPRLLYGASFGAALLWALPLTALQPGRRRLARTLSAAALVIAAALSGLPYSMSVRALLAETNQIIEQVKKSFEGVNGRILSVNFPSAVFLNQEIYLIGYYHPSILPENDAGDLASLIRLNGGPEYSVEHLRVRELFPQEPWKFRPAYWVPNASLAELYARARGGAVLFRAFPLDTVTMLRAGRLQAEGGEPAARYLARYGGQVALLDAGATVDAQMVRLALTWQCWQTPGTDTRVLLQLYRGGEKIGEQVDIPLLEMAPMETWQAGDTWHDIHYIPLRDGPAPGSMTVRVGLVEAGSGARLPALDGAGQPLADGLLELAVAPDAPAD